MIFCLCRYLYIVELLFIVGGFVNLKDGNKVLFIFNYLMKYLGEIENLIKLGLIVR